MMHGQKQIKFILMKCMLTFQKHNMCTNYTLCRLYNVHICTDRLHIPRCACNYAYTI